MTGRTRMRDRRLAITRKIPFTFSESGKEIHLLTTFGVDDHGRIREVFCADFRAGTSMHFVVTDACVLLSRELQRDVDPRDLLGRLSEPRSLIGALLAAAIEEQEHLDAAKAGA